MKAAEFDLIRKDGLDEAELAAFILINLLKFDASNWNKLESECANPSSCSVSIKPSIWLACCCSWLIPPAFAPKRFGGINNQQAKSNAA